MTVKALKNEVMIGLLVEVGEENDLLAVVLGMANEGSPVDVLLFVQVLS